MSGEFLGIAAAWTVAAIWVLGAVTTIALLVHVSLRIFWRIRAQILGLRRINLALKLLREHDAAKRGEG